MYGGLMANVAVFVLTAVGTGSPTAVTLSGSSAWAAFGVFFLALAAQSLLPFLTSTLTGDS